MLQRTYFLIIEMSNLSKNTSQWPHNLKTSVKIVGYLPGRLVQQYNQQPERQDPIYYALLNACERGRRKNEVNPIGVVSQNGCLALRDSDNKVWLIADVFDEPICINELLRLSISQVALAHNQIVLNTKDGVLLLSWGGRLAFGEEQLVRMEVRNHRHKFSYAFDLHKVRGVQHKQRFYFGHPGRGSEDSWLFSVPNNMSQLISYPSATTISLPSTPKGLSIGKHLILYWDDDGNLYSWGCRSIALGYGSIPSQQFIPTPRKITRIERVAKAYAGANYCLAITYEGKIYEWGIKRMPRKQDQLIFYPREMDLDDQRQRFIDINGKGDMYAALTLSGRLFVWGKGSKRFVPQEMIYNDEDPLEPINICKEHGYIHDFTITDSFIAVVTANQHCTALSLPRRAYWDHYKQNVRDGLKLRGKLKTEGSPRSKLKFSLKDFSESVKIMNSRIKDPVTEALQSIRSKETYLSAASQSDCVIEYILKPTQRHHTEASDFESHSSNTTGRQHPTKKPFQIKRTMAKVTELNKKFSKEKPYLTSLMSPLHTKKPQTPFRTMRSSDMDRLQVKTSHTRRYSSKLREVLEKRKLHEQVKINNAVKKLETESFEYRQEMRHEKEESLKREKQSLVWQQSIQKLLIKRFMVNLLSAPLAEGREALIENFARHLKFERVQRNIRGLFLRTRIKMNLKAMRSKSLGRFFLLIVYFRRHVKRYREKAYEASRKQVVTEMIKDVLKEKLRQGLLTAKFNARKLMKCSEWLSMVRRERKKCLKAVWKMHLLSIMRINNEVENAIVVHVPKKVEEITFQSIYSEKLLTNPELKLVKFLEKCSIFRFKAGFMQKLATIFGEYKRSKRSSRMSRNVSLKRTKMLRFIARQDEEDEANRFNLLNTDVMPYSMHFNILIHPKHLCIPVPQIMKQSERWVKEEKRLFERQLNDIVRRHQLHYRERRREYDLKLASFIRKNYERLAQCRWRFILEYNQIHHNVTKAKQEKELRRLLRMIGAERLVDEDCIPEKHAILAEAKRQSDAPQEPTSHIQFGGGEFKATFKLYYESVNGRMKELRKSFF